MSGHPQKASGSCQKVGILSKSHLTDIVVYCCLCPIYLNPHNCWCMFLSVSLYLLVNDIYIYMGQYSHIRSPTSHEEGIEALAKAIPRCQKLALLTSFSRRVGFCRFEHGDIPNINGFLWIIVTFPHETDI